MSTSAKVEEFRNVFEQSLTDIAERTGGVSASDESVRERCIILSGGVDTCAIMSAARKLGIKFGGALTVVTGDESPDLGFSSACAAEHGLEHHIVRLTADELVDIFLPDTIELLKIYNGMLLRNSLVIAAVFKKAAALGFKHAFTGDGADELFGGYSFMWRHTDPVVWREKRDSMCAQWTFSTDELAGKYGITAHSAYTADRTTQWAIQNTERSDCICVRPIRLFYGGPFKDHETGKLILREAYDTVSSWRRKDPIEVGSGVTIIGKDPFWSERLSDDEFEAETKALVDRGYIIQSKENLVNFRIWEKTFGTDGVKLTKDDLSAMRGMKQRLPLGQGCVGCCFDVGDTMFCNLCGAYPAQRGVILEE
mmetsp:Transcript_37103/g.68126  ORF Transcript_37103/g.68126 Transcript_37103/m.68126 type:complete len:367 (-) Transcript_37103:50-1150(-)